METPAAWARELALCLVRVGPLRCPSDNEPDARSDDFVQFRNYAVEWMRGPHRARLPGPDDPSVTASDIMGTDSSEMGSDSSDSDAPTQPQGPTVPSAAHPRGPRSSGASASAAATGNEWTSNAVPPAFQGGQGSGEGVGVPRALRRVGAPGA